MDSKIGGFVRQMIHIFLPTDIPGIDNFFTFLNKIRFGVLDISDEVNLKLQQTECVNAQDRSYWNLTTPEHQDANESLPIRSAIIECFYVTPRIRIAFNNGYYKLKDEIDLSFIDHEVESLTDNEIREFINFVKYKWDSENRNTESNSIPNHQEHTWFPKTNKTYNLWKRIYAVIQSLNDDYIEDFNRGFTTNPKPKIEDYRDAINEALGIPRSEKTILNIIKAGKEGWLD